MKTFIYPSEILPFTQWVLLYLNALLVRGEKSKYFVGTQYVPGVPDPGKTDSTCVLIIFTQCFIHINEYNQSLMCSFLIGSLFCDIRTKQQWRSHDIPKHTFLNPSQHQPPMQLSEQSILLTCVQAENDTMLSLVTASVGFTMEGFAP